MNTLRPNILISWRLLYYTYAFIPIIVGLDKYFDYLANWNIYLNPLIPQYLYITPETFMNFVGIIEIIVGFLVLLKPRLGGYIVFIWLIAISINLVTMGTHTHEHSACIMMHYDVALRDIAMAIGAYVFVLLSKELNR